MWVREWAKWKKVQEVQTSSHKINVMGYNVQHGDYSQRYCTVHYVTLYGDGKTRLMIILQCIQIPNHYVVYLQLI